MIQPLSMRSLESALVASVLIGAFSSVLSAAELPPTVRDLISDRCADCHDAETKKGGLDLEGLSRDWRDGKTFSQWVKIHDRVASGEMPPKKKPQPEAGAREAFLAGVSAGLTAV